MIPAHTTDGYLPQGIHSATWTEFTARFVTTARRAAIVDRVLPALSHLADCGCPAVLVAGSFVTAKDAPADIDVLWSDRGVDFDQLSDMFTTLEGLEYMKRTLGADIIPAYLTEAASGLPFPAFFQLRKDGRGLCGVVALDLTTMPRSDP